MTRAKTLLLAASSIGIVYVISYVFLWSQVESGTLQRRPQLPLATIETLKTLDIHLSSMATATQRRQQTLQSEKQEMGDQLASLSIQELLLSTRVSLEKLEDLIDKANTQLIRVNDGLMSGAPRDGIVVELRTLPDLEKNLQELQDTIDVSVARNEGGLRVDPGALTHYAYLNWQSLSVYNVGQRQLSQDQKDSSKEISELASRFNDIVDLLPVFYSTGGIFVL
jgi:hypothetical protein